MWASDPFVYSVGMMVLFGLSAMGFGLFLGRILFGASRTSDAPPVPTDVSSQATAEIDLRASPRTPVAQTKVLVSHNMPLAEPFEGWLTDRSLGGLGLSVSQPVEIGTVLRLMPEQLPDWISSLTLEVRYCRLHRGRWRLGCQYVSG